jgi:hypothetical protein
MRLSINLLTHCWLDIKTSATVGSGTKQVNCSRRTIRYLDHDGAHLQILSPFLAIQDVAAPGAQTSLPYGRAIIDPVLQRNASRKGGNTRPKDEMP